MLMKGVATTSNTFDDKRISLVVNLRQNGFVTEDETHTNRRITFDLIYITAVIFGMPELDNDALDPSRVSGLASRSSNALRDPKVASDDPRVRTDWLSSSASASSLHNILRSTS